MTAPTSYFLRGRVVAGGTGELHAGTQTVSFDATWGQGPSGLPGPADLLASAFAPCLLKSTERASELMPFRYDSAEVTVDVQRQDRPPKFTRISFELRVTTDEGQDRLDLLHRNLQKYGTVYNTLAAACSVEGRIMAIPPTATVAS